MTTANERTHLSGDDAPTEESAFLFLTLETAEILAEKWKSILLLGILNILTGILCLLFPVIATKAVSLCLTSIVLLIGLFHIFISTADERTGQGRRHPFFLVGVILILVALFLLLNPIFTLTFLTFLIAVVFMMMGSAQFAFARRNRQLAGRAMHFVSGVLSVAMSILIVLTMPASQWFTIGVLLGVNFINIGVSRTMLALYGRALAQSAAVEEMGWYSYMETDRL